MFARQQQQHSSNKLRGEAWTEAVLFGIWKQGRRLGMKINRTKNGKMKNKENKSIVYLPVVSVESFSAPREIFSSRGTKLPAMEHKNSKLLQKFDSRYPAIPSTRNSLVLYAIRDLSIQTLAQRIREMRESTRSQSLFLFSWPFADGHNRYPWRPSTWELLKN